MSLDPLLAAADLPPLPWLAGILTIQRPATYQLLINHVGFWIVRVPF